MLRVYPKHSLDLKNRETLPNQEWICMKSFSRLKSALLWLELRSILNTIIANIFFLSIGQLLFSGIDQKSTYMVAYTPIDSDVN